MIELFPDLTGFQSVTVMGGDTAVQTAVTTLFILAVRRRQGEERELCSQSTDWETLYIKNRGLISRRKLLCSYSTNQMYFYIKPVVLDIDIDNRYLYPNFCFDDPVYAWRCCWKYCYTLTSVM